MNIKAFYSEGLESRTNRLILSEGQNSRSRAHRDHIGVSVLNGLPYLRWTINFESYSPTFDGCFNYGEGIESYYGPTLPAIGYWCSTPNLALLCKRIKCACIQFLDRPHQISQCLVEVLYLDQPSFYVGITSLRKQTDHPAERSILSAVQPEKPGGKRTRGG